MAKVAETATRARVNQFQERRPGDGTEVLQMFSADPIGTRCLARLHFPDLILQLLSREGLAGAREVTTTMACERLHGLQARLGASILLLGADLATHGGVRANEGRGILTVLHGQTAMVPQMAWPGHALCVAPSIFFRILVTRPTFVRLLSSLVAKGLKAVRRASSSASAALLFAVFHSSLVAREGFAWWA